MSQPGPEARIANLEKEAMALGARIEEAASDTAEELKAVRQDIKQLDERMKAGFLEMGTAFDLNVTNIEAVKQDVASIKTTQERQESLLQEILNRLPPKP
jgi:DNA repair exonuclease SbcCD ATPase subunit